jgi:ubiquinone/menaquinone biosynthesis C-methylase UbiE
LERSEYAKLSEVEDEMWWFRGAHANLMTAFRRCMRRHTTGGTILDAGCGTGGLLTRLVRDLPAWTAVGLDADVGACTAARAKSRASVCAGSANSLPFPDRSLAAIFSADVLCHRNVDDVTALRDFHRCLAAGGVLVLNLPAYGWLLSAHDRAVHNERRYDRQHLLAMLESAGFAKIRATYWNTILFPIMVIRRMVLGSADGTSDVKRFPGAVEAAFRGVMRFENTLLRHGVRLPFGGSILATAVKP